MGVVLLVLSLLVVAMIRGIDASAVQGKLDPGMLLDAGYEFVYHKCRQGNDGIDPLFEVNKKALLEAGIRVGAYHFAYPLPHLDAKAQAELYFSSSDCGTNIGELPVALDMEWPAPEQWAGKWKCTAPQIGEWFRICLERMKELYNHRPVVYTYPWFVTALLRGGAKLGYLSDYPLWMADYSHSGKHPSEGMAPIIPAPWRGRNWMFWQYDGNRGLRLPNGTDSDFNVFNGTREDLDRLVGIKPIEVPDQPIVHTLEYP